MARQGCTLLAALLIAAVFVNADAACAGTYTVQSGDSLSGIAQAKGVTLSALESANPDISDPDKIYAGQVINIPPCDSGSSSCKYTVKSGDSLSGIAEQYGTTTAKLQELNPSISDPNKIYAGQSINVPCSGPVPEPVPSPSPSPEPVPSPAPSGGVDLTADEFQKALSACGFDSQDDSKRVNLLASIAQQGGADCVATRRELAMYLAQVFHESAGLQFVKEIGGESASYAPYYGRGYIQLTNKDNYEKASQALFGDDRLVSNPDLVLEDDIAWRTTSWYWTTRVHGLDGVAQGQFGATTRGINGGECSANPERAAVRCKYYGEILPVLGLNEQPDCSGC